MGRHDIRVLSRQRILYRDRLPSVLCRDRPLKDFCCDRVCPASCSDRVSCVATGRGAGTAKACATGHLESSTQRITVRACSCARDSALSRALFESLFKNTVHGHC